MRSKLWQKIIKKMIKNDTELLLILRNAPKVKKKIIKKKHQIFYKLYPSIYPKTHTEIDKKKNNYKTLKRK